MLNNVHSRVSWMASIAPVFNAGVAKFLFQEHIFSSETVLVLTLTSSWRNVVYEKNIKFFLHSRAKL